MKTITTTMIAAAAIAAVATTNPAHAAQSGRDWQILAGSTGQCESMATTNKQFGIRATSPAEMDVFYRRQGLFPSINVERGDDNQVIMVTMKIPAFKGMEETGFMFFPSRELCQIAQEALEETRGSQKELN